MCTEIHLLSYYRGFYDSSGRYRNPKHQPKEASNNDKKEKKATPPIKYIMRRESLLINVTNWVFPMSSSTEEFMTGRTYEIIILVYGSQPFDIVYSFRFGESIQNRAFTMGGSYPHREVKPVEFLINAAHTSFLKLMVSLPRDFSLCSEKKKKRSAN
ncbi:hypothetical protein CDAR_384401 [Caerostris darwini]|uniref:Uncharacterized protein n=1 Tax=Caerostris darwini TaxID=1538125 RepID=A0AAV4M5F6_9ARAC|nr:hypothetical protein CDAR_384401 [Caerostris darwini]